MHHSNVSVQYTTVLHGYKNDNFLMKKSDIFLIFAQNVDRGYTLEQPHCLRAKIRNKVHIPVNPNFII